MGREPSHRSLRPRRACGRPEAPSDPTESAARGRRRPRTRGWAERGRPLAGETGAARRARGLGHARGSAGAGDEPTVLAPGRRAPEREGATGAEGPHLPALGRGTSGRRQPLRNPVASRPPGPKFWRGPRLPPAKHTPEDGAKTTGSPHWKPFSEGTVRGNVSHRYRCGDPTAFLDYDATVSRTWPRTGSGRGCPGRVGASGADRGEDSHSFVRCGTRVSAVMGVSWRAAQGKRRELVDGPTPRHSTPTRYKYRGPLRQ